MRNVFIILKKQLKDTLKNKTVLIQFLLFPVMTLVMEHAITLNDMPELFFTRLFSTMYIGMAPLTAMAAVISEEKEKNTLRVLMMANIKPWQYLIGTGSYVFLICMAGAGVMASGLPLTAIPFYMLIMAAGFLLSILTGACVGIFAENQMAATSLTMPVMMILSFLPMLSMFNDSIRKIARIFYTQQLKLCLDHIPAASLTFSVFGEALSIILINAIFIISVYVVIYKRKGLE